MSLLQKIAINCQRATYLHEKNREGKLDAMERLGLWIHLLYCKFCKAFFKQIDVIETSSKKLSDNPAPSSGLSDSKKTALQKAFDEQLKK